MDNDIYTCPECGRPSTSGAELRALLAEHGAIGVSMTPGGPRITFSDGRELYLGGMCHVCDERQAREFLAANPPIQGGNPSHGGDALSEWLYQHGVR